MHHNIYPRRHTWDYQHFRDTETTKALYGPTQQILKAAGQFHTRLSHREKSSEEIVFVICGLKWSLLRLPAIQVLHLIFKIEPINSEHETKRFTSLFHAGTWQPWRSLQHTAEKGCPATCHLHTSKCANTPPWKGKRGTKWDGDSRSHFQSETTYFMMCRHGCGSRELGCNMHLRRSKTLNESVLWEVFPIPAVSHTQHNLQEQRNSPS